MQAMLTNTNCGKLMLTAATMSLIDVVITVSYETDGKIRTSQPTSVAKTVDNLNWLPVAATKLLITGDFGEFEPAAVLNYIQQNVNWLKARVNHHVLSCATKGGEIGSKPGMWCLRLPSKMWQSVQKMDESTKLKTVLKWAATTGFVIASAACVIVGGLLTIVGGFVGAVAGTLCGVAKCIATGTFKSLRVVVRNQSNTEDSKAMPDAPPMYYNPEAMSYDPPIDYHPQAMSEGEGEFDETPLLFFE